MQELYYVEKTYIVQLLSQTKFPNEKPVKVDKQSQSHYN